MTVRSQTDYVTKDTREAVAASAVDTAPPARITGYLSPSRSNTPANAGRVSPSRPDIAPPPGNAGRLSPSLASLPPAPSPCNKPAVPARRPILPPSSRPGSEPTPPRPAPQDRGRKVQSSLDAPPPLAPRRSPQRASSPAVRTALPEPDYPADDVDLLNQFVPMTASTTSSSSSSTRSAGQSSSRRYS